ncbi:unnamed protein product, partial [Tetraodon nigroviridis]
MAKRKECAGKKTDTKRLKRDLKAKKSGGNLGAKNDQTDKDITEEEENIIRKVEPKPRRSKQPAVGNKTTTKTKTTTDFQTSKYFQSSVKKEESDSEEDFDTGWSAAPPAGANKKKVEKDAEGEQDSEEDEDDWEEVEELSEPLGPVEAQEPALPSQSLEIEIETPEVRKERKRQAEWETYVRRMVNRYKKDLLVDMHKVKTPTQTSAGLEVHLMCLIARGMFQNRLCSQPDLLAITLSLLPTHFSMVAKDRVDQNFLSGLLRWCVVVNSQTHGVCLTSPLWILPCRFRTTFTLNPSLPCERRADPRLLLEGRLASLSARNHEEMTHLFLLVLRSLQLFCRLVLSLQPVPLKLPPAKVLTLVVFSRLLIFVQQGKSAARTSEKSNANQEKRRCDPKQTGDKRPINEGKSSGGRGGKKAKRVGAEKETEQREEEKSTPSAGQRPKNSTRRSIASKVSYKEESSSDGEEKAASDDDFQVSSEEEDGVDSENEAISTKRAGKRRSKQDSGGKRKQDSRELEEKEEMDEGGGGGGGPGNGAKRRSGRKKEGLGDDEWLEVYLAKTSSWICVDVEQGIGMPHLCSQKASSPVTYVVSVDGDGFVKDLGRKYDPTWMTLSRKRRVEEDWWEDTLAPFMGPEDEKDQKEDKELQKTLLNKPLPISVAEYKNHPLYALKRHLLKYEAIYPSTAAVLGYCRGEAVYSRDCVHTLHSRDTWLKEARTVGLGEEPYKMVKGFSNRSRKARMMSELKNENDLALFGEWQTEEYQPPIAVDGKVPRNDFGNVYLFKPSMLPVGCVHLRLSNLHRVAKKLSIDAAPAVTGFDFHGGYSHAVTDGYIVCEEFEEILQAAWLEEQELLKQKEKEKREKRVTSNWALLVKGLLIREKLKKRYSTKNQGLRTLADGDEPGGLSSDEEAQEGASPAAKTASETLAMSWPQNRQEEEEKDFVSGLQKKKMTKREKRGQDKHLFPFEK